MFPDFVDDIVTSLPLRFYKLLTPAVRNCRWSLPVGQEGQKCFKLVEPTLSNDVDGSGRYVHMYNACA